MDQVSEINIIIIIINNNNKQDSSFIEYFPYCHMDTEIKDVSELLMVTGFVAKRIITHVKY